jgi:hypothetical protein
MRTEKQCIFILFNMDKAKHLCTNECERTFSSLSPHDILNFSLLF